jgi:hypothetical protein
MTRKSLKTFQENFPVDSPMSKFMIWRLENPTRHQYITNLKLFFKSLKLQGSLDQQSREFIAKAKNDIEWAEDGLKYFIHNQIQRAENGELANSTIRNYCKPVKLFCDLHKITLSWKMIKNTLPKGRRHANDRAPTREEIQTIIEYPDRRIKPLVLTECSSGIRVGAWKYLKWKHVEPIKRDDKIVAAKITVYAGEYEQYFSFMTPEAFQALQEWMDYRKKCGEEINGESWLMRTLWDTATPAFNSKINSPKKISQSAIRGLMERALKAQHLRAGLDLKTTRRYEFKAHHGFRKFFQTNADLKMKSLYVEMLMGHDIGLAASYSKPKVDELLEEYLKAVDSLTIDKERLLSRTAVEKVSENQQMLLVQMESKDKEIQELKEQLYTMRSEMNDVLEVLNIAKSKDGMLGKDRTMLDEKGRVTFGYVDNNNQIVEMKIPLKEVEIDRVATSQPPSVSIPIDGVKANNFIRQVSKDVAKQAQATKKRP